MRVGAGNGAPTSASKFLILDGPQQSRSLGYQAYCRGRFLRRPHRRVQAFTAGSITRAIARACDCYGQRIADPAELGLALDDAAARGGVTLLDIVTDPLAYPPVTAFDAKPWGAATGDHSATNSVTPLNVMSRPVGERADAEILGSVATWMADLQ